MPTRRAGACPSQQMAKRRLRRRSTAVTDSMRALVLLAMVAVTARVDAQSVVTSSAPQRVAVTVYRNPDRGTEPLNLDWLGGYALVSETRHVRLPAGTSELRFEGVTSGIVPQSAIITGLGEAV